jgi:hypothetical protein
LLTPLFDMRDLQFNFAVRPSPAGWMYVVCRECIGFVTTAGDVTRRTIADMALGSPAARFIASASGLTSQDDLVVLAVDGRCGVEYYRYRGQPGADGPRSLDAVTLVWLAAGSLRERRRVALPLLPSMADFARFWERAMVGLVPLPGDSVLVYFSLPAFRGGPSHRHLVVYQVTWSGVHCEVTCGAVMHAAPRDDQDAEPRADLNVVPHVSGSLLVSWAPWRSHLRATDMCVRRLAWA